MPRVYIPPTQRDCTTSHTVLPARQFRSTQRRNLSNIPLVAIEFSTTQKLYYWGRYPSPEEYQESGITTPPRIFSYQLTTFTDQHSAEIAVSEMLSHYNTHKWFTEAQGLNTLISDLAKRICSSLPTRISSRLIQVTLPLHLVVEVFALYGNGDIRQLRAEIGRLHASLQEEEVKIQVSEDEDCVICLNKLIDSGLGKIKRLPCSHCFHKKCIGDWFRRANTCPLCRKNG